MKIKGLSLPPLPLKSISNNQIQDFWEGFFHILDTIFSRARKCSATKYQVNICFNGFFVPKLKRGMGIGVLKITLFFKQSSI